MTLDHPALAGVEAQHTQGGAVVEHLLRDRQTAEEINKSTGGAYAVLDFVGAEATVNYGLGCLRKGGMPAAKLVPRVTVLSTDELRSLFSGNTATGDSTRGKWHVYWAADGKAFMRTFSGQTDAGNWELNDGGVFCRQWKNFGGGRKSCFILVKKGDEYELWTADRSKMRGTLIVRPGNPENL